MDDETATNTPSHTLSFTDEGIVECMKKSKSRKDWEVRENNFRFKLGDDFNTIWTRAILLSGVAEEVFKNFDEVENPWQDIKISENSNRVAPL